MVISYARQLNDFMVIPEAMGALSLGANLKLDSSRIDNAKGLSSGQGSGVDLDFAVMFKPNDFLSWGTCLSNTLGKNAKPNIAGGIAGKLFDDKVTWSVEGKRMGLEVKFIPELALRLGQGESGGTTGVGLNLGDFIVDYAYVGGQSPAHYVGISIAVDKPTNNLI